MCVTGSKDLASLYIHGYLENLIHFNLKINLE